MKLSTLAAIVACTVVVASCTDANPVSTETQSTATGEMSGKSDNAATVWGHRYLAEIGEDYCAATDSEENLVFQYDRKAMINVITKAGTMIFKCRMDGVPNSTGRVMEWSGESTGETCWTFFGVTDNWTQRLTPSGVANITCQVNPSR